MDRIPFSVYDFFGYLAPGFLLLAAIDFLWLEGVLLHSDPGVILGLFLVTVAYIVGHILAGPSAWLLERIIVGKMLAMPNIHLFNDGSEASDESEASDASKAWWSKLFSHYFTPLPKVTQAKIKKKAKVEGITDTGEALFLHAFAKVKADAETMARLNIFLYLYGFSRNISFTLLLVSLLIAVGSLMSGTWDMIPWASGALVGSVAMFYRYLKFFREYSHEVFITYAALPSKK